MTDNAGPDPIRPALPRALARFNRRITNRVQGLWAPYLAPWAVVVHTGRKSGNTYATPVLAFRYHDRIAIGLPYGRETQWVGNLLAAHGGQLRRAGRTLRLENPRVVDSRAAGLRPGARGLGRLTDSVLVATLA
ncbi:nitroreductase family deazaflavin-dependent oxidoreductase [Nocardia sp. NPDC004722]